MWGGGCVLVGANLHRGMCWNEISANTCPVPPGVSPRSSTGSGYRPPPGVSSTARGFAPGYRPPALQAAPGTLIRAVGPRDDSPGRNPGWNECSLAGIWVYQAYALKGQINPAQGNALGLRMPKENPPRSAILPPPCPSRVGGGLQSAVRRVRPFDPGCRSARWRRSTLGWVDLPLRGASGRIRPPSTLL